MKKLGIITAMAAGLGMQHPSMLLPRLRAQRVRDRDKLSPERVSQLKDDADLKRQRKSAKRVRDVLCGGWSASGYTTPYNRRVNLSARKG